MPWEQLKQTIDFNRQARAQDASQPPEACPIDGTPLEENSEGVRNCPMGNYVWRGGIGTPITTS